MRFGMIGAVMVMTLVGRPAMAQTKEDSVAARGVVRDYLVAWYDGDAALMEQVLHPELAKRNLNTDANGRTRFSHMGAMAMVRAARGRTKQPADQRPIEVTLLDIQATAAAAKVVSWDFVDYVHLAKADGRWVIVNDLWVGRPR